MFIIQSCKKNEHHLDINVDESSKIKKTEVAYPNINGEMFKVFYNGTEIFVEKKLDRYVWLGDIAFDQKTFDSLKIISNTVGRTFRPTLDNHWPNGQVNYIIGSGFTTNEINSINNAMSDYLNKTSLHSINYLQYNLTVIIF
ncbi:hypothetical protein ACFOWM_03035 [Ferruginibacter yonginensis]|uniref:Uncharacterized protein n=1 Tax=Ferruginibacter yonginensis TaxID=1310416 RepID=A0ABV8QQD8_9BACT